ncbi:MAG: FKBP-type peptidyl-prolyl cis-trans isomerase [Microbacteriaceae bacterium]
MRRIIAVAVSAGLAVAALTGCTSLPENCTPDGDASKAVSVTGDFGVKPVVTFEKGLTVTETQRSVIIGGSGDAIETGQTITMDYSLYNGTTGEVIEASPYAPGQEVSYPVDTAATQFVGLSKALACSQVGTRVVGVIPNPEGFGEQASAAGLGATDVLVFVIDVKGFVAKPLAEATGTPVEPTEGFPTVEFVDGNPNVTFPEGPVPTEYGLATLIQGDGDEVPEGATVVVNYEGVNWNTGKVFDSSFDRGEPSTFGTGKVIAGFRDALVGQKIGSRVIVIIPSELGYGEAGNGDSIGGSDTIVFVVDILGLG